MFGKKNAPEKFNRGEKKNYSNIPDEFKDRFGKFMEHPVRVLRFGQYETMDASSALVNKLEIFEIDADLQQRVNAWKKEQPVIKTSDTSNTPVRRPGEHDVVISVISSSGGSGATTISKRLLQQEPDKSYRGKYARGFEEYLGNIKHGKKNLDVLIKEFYPAHIERKALMMSDVAIFVFDVNNARSFEDVENELKVFRVSNKDVPCILVGNKIDVEDQRVVSDKRAQAFATANNMSYITTSGKENINIDALKVIALDKALTFKLKSKTDSSKIVFDTQPRETFQNFLGDIKDRIDSDAYRNPPSSFFGWQLQIKPEVPLDIAKLKDLFRNLNMRKLESVDAEGFVKETVKILLDAKSSLISSLRNDNINKLYDEFIERGLAVLNTTEEDFKKNYTPSHKI